MNRSWPIGDTDALLIERLEQNDSSQRIQDLISHVGMTLSDTIDHDAGFTTPLNLFAAAGPVVRLDFSG